MTSSEFRSTADAFTKAYVEAALWSSSAELGKCDQCDSGRVTVNPETECCASCGGKVWGTDRSFQDLEMEVDSIAEQTLDSIVADCAKFQMDNAELLIDGNNLKNGVYTTDERAGQDFWLTRNGHGCGFWDGDWAEPAATKLTEASKAFGEVSLYIGDDGLIYACAS